MPLSSKFFYVIISLLVSLGLFFSPKYLDFKVNYDKFFDLSVTIFTVMTGFFLTISTLLGNIRNDKLNFVRRSNKMHIIYKDLREAIKVGFLAIICSSIFFLIENLICRLPIIINVFVAVNIYSFIFCLSIFEIFLKAISED